MKKRLFLIALLIVAFYIRVRAQVPYNLNSNPNAAPTVLLDFDGQTVTDQFWTWFTNDSAFYVQPATLTTAQIIKIFNHIAEDFSPFNINITTDSTVYFRAPVSRRTRAIFTPTSSWYGSAGGVAFVESFRWGFDVPCFIFSSALGNNDKRCAEAGSHEIGHTLGLYHQARYAYVNTDTCRFLEEYFSGKGSLLNAETSWAPIMGNSYQRNLSTWHIGISSTGCTFPQNDFAVITNPINGITYRSDDHGNTINTGTDINLSDGNFLANGLINDSNDLDHFRFQINTPGRLTVNAKPYSTGKEILAISPLGGITHYNANVDIEATLFNGNLQIRKYNPTNLLNASFDTLLNPGTYSLRVNSTSNINASKSGMAGTYSVEGSFSTSVTVPIRFINIKGFLSKNEHVIIWEILSDGVVEDIALEFSDDGVVYKLLSYFNEKEYKYSYRPLTNDEYYYRIKASSGGQIYYSNPVLIRSNNSYDYVLFNNPVLNELKVNAKSIYTWKLLDLAGKTIDGGKFVPGFNYINMANKARGFYFLHIFTSMDNFIERVIKM